MEAGAAVSFSVMEPLFPGVQIGAAVYFYCGEGGGAAFPLEGVGATVSFHGDWNHNSLL